MNIINSVLNGIIKVLLNENIRWLFYFTALFLTVLAYINEPIRFSGEIGSIGTTYQLQLYIFAILNLVSYFISFLSLWITIPFSFKLPRYWFFALFILIIAIYTEFYMNSKIYREDGSLNLPPSYLYPSYNRLLIHYFILAIDIIIFAQFFFVSPMTNKNIITYFDKYLLSRFGGWTEGNKISFIVSWLSLYGLSNDIYNIYLQSNFKACDYNLPKSWDF